MLNPVARYFEASCDILCLGLVYILQFSTTTPRLGKQLGMKTEINSHVQKYDIIVVESHKTITKALSRGLKLLQRKMSLEFKDSLVP